MGPDTAAARTAAPPSPALEEASSASRRPACSQQPPPPSFLRIRCRDAGAHLHRHLLQCSSASAPPAPCVEGGGAREGSALGAWPSLPPLPAAHAPPPSWDGCIWSRPGASFLALEGCRNPDLNVKPSVRLLYILLSKFVRAWQTTATIRPLSSLFSLWPKAKDTLLLWMHSQAWPRFFFPGFPMVIFRLGIAMGLCNPCFASLRLRTLPQEGRAWAYSPL